MFIPSAGEVITHFFVPGVVSPLLLRECPNTLPAELIGVHNGFLLALLLFSFSERALCFLVFCFFPGIHAINQIGPILPFGRDGPGDGQLSEVQTDSNGLSV